MGLKLRLNLFHEREADQVYWAYEQFYAGRGQRFLDEGEDGCDLVLHERDCGWTVLELDSGWEWVVRREAQLYASRLLGCSGFLVFVYDGDYWGYEFFRDGRVLDQFVQEEEPADGTSWFPGRDCTGSPKLIADEFDLAEEDVAAYLVRDPVWSRWNIDPDSDAGEQEWQRRRAEKERLDKPVRPGDEFSRFDECAVLDFLRFLGIRVELANHFATLESPVWRTFWIEGQSTLNDWLRRYRRSG